MNKKQLITNFKLFNPDIKVGSTQNAKITEAELLTVLNAGAKDIARLTKCIPNIRSDSLVQYQYKYDLNSNVFGIDDEGGLRIYESTSERHLKRKTIDYWDSVFSNWRTATPSTPREYARRGNELYLRPNTDTAAYTTTLNGGITAAATTMKLTTSTYFPARFRCLIDSEVIECQYHSSGDCYALDRGLEGTTAAIHADGATITMRNLLMFTYEKPEEMSDDTDDPFNNLTYLEPYHDIILRYAQWKLKPIVNDKYDAQKGEQEYKQEVQRMNKEIKEMPDLRHDKLRMFSYVEHYRTAF
jgi:hypothetical protein